MNSNVRSLFDTMQFDLPPVTASSKRAPVPEFDEQQPPGIITNRNQNEVVDTYLCYLFFSGQFAKDGYLQVIPEQVRKYVANNVPYYIQQEAAREHVVNAMIEMDRKNNTSHYNDYTKSFKKYVPYSEITTLVRVNTIGDSDDPGWGLDDMFMSLTDSPAYIDQALKSGYFAGAAGAPVIVQAFKAEYTIPLFSATVALVVHHQLRGKLNENVVLDALSEYNQAARNVEREIDPIRKDKTVNRINTMLARVETLIPPPEPAPLPVSNQMNEDPAPVVPVVSVAEAEAVVQQQVAAVAEQAAAQIVNVVSEAQQEVANVVQAARQEHAEIVEQIVQKAEEIHANQIEEIKQVAEHEHAKQMSDLEEAANAEHQRLMAVAKQELEMMEAAKEESDRKLAQAAAIANSAVAANREANSNADGLILEVEALEAEKLALLEKTKLLEEQLAKKRSLYAQVPKPIVIEQYQAPEPAKITPKPVVEQYLKPEPAKITPKPIVEQYVQPMPAKITPKPMVEQPTAAPAVIYDQTFPTSPLYEALAVSKAIQYTTLPSNKMYTKLPAEIYQLPQPAQPTRNDSELEKAKRIARKWWAAHPKGKKRDINLRNQKVVTKAANYVPSKNDFRGVDLFRNSVSVNRKK